MMPTNAIEKRLDNFAGKKTFTGRIVHSALEQYRAGLLPLDISKDYYTRFELGEKLERVKNCSSILELRKYDGGLTSIHNGNFCNMPVVCAVCADRSSRKKKAIFKPRIEQAAARFKYIYMLTMTIKDGPVLEERLNALTGSRKRFRLFGQRRIMKRMKIYQENGKWYEYKRGDEIPEKLHSLEVYRNDSGEWSKVRAAICSTEIVWGEDSHEIHCHDHALIFTNQMIDYRIFDEEMKRRIIKEASIVEKNGEYFAGGVSLSKIQYMQMLAPAVVEWAEDCNGVRIPVSKLSKEWIEATRGQGFNIDVHPLSYSSYKANPYFKGEKCESFPKWIAAQAGEVLKYNSKLAEGMQKKEVTPAQYVHLIQRRGSRRLFNTYGAFRNRRDSLYLSKEQEAYLDYVDWREAQSYEIRRSEFVDKKYVTRLQSESRAVFSHSDKQDNVGRLKLSRQAKLVAWFRNVKAEALAGREFMEANTAARGAADTEEWKDRIERFIDDAKRILRAKLKNVWLEAIPPGAAVAFSPAPF
jgi:hypothetical protein